VNDSADKKKSPSFWSFENLRSLALLLLAVFAFRWSVGQPYEVPTSSMEPTIKVGDRLLGNKLAFHFTLPFTSIVAAEWAQPQRGDIVVFPCPNDTSNDCVKRVVGIGGDEIKIIEDTLYINGTPQPRIDTGDNRAVLDDIADTASVKLLYRETLGTVEHFTMVNKADYKPDFGVEWASTEFPPHKVPPRHVFCMGDNRDNSIDSRFWGTVPLEAIKGQATRVLWSAYIPKGTWIPNVRFYRFGRALE
jgi:signal peptidase I